MVSLKKLVFGSLVVVFSGTLLASPAIAGCSRGDVESNIRQRYDGFYMPSRRQYNALQAIPIAVDVYLTGGSISQEWAVRNLSEVAIDSARFLADNNFDPNRDVLIGDVMTFQCWSDLLGRALSGYNIFVPYIAIRRQQGDDLSRLVGDGTHIRSAAGNYYLDHRLDGWVGLSQNPEDGGTRWEIVDIGNQQVRLKSTAGNYYLDHRLDGWVGLSQNPEDGGTRWIISH